MKTKLMTVFIIFFITTSLIGCGSYDQSSTVYDKSNLIGQWKVTVYTDNSRTRNENWIQNIDFDSNGNLIFSGDFWENSKDLTIDGAGNISFVVIYSPLSNPPEQLFTGKLDQSKLTAQGTNIINNEICDWTWEKVVTSN